MKALLLAGGYGTRLFPLTLRTPKPLLPVAGKPVLEFTLDMLRDAKINEVIISLKENQRKIEHYFGDGSRHGIKIRYLYEPETTEAGKMGSVGAINYVLSRIKTRGDILVIGGDNFVIGLNISEFAKKHKSASAHASIALFDLESKEHARHFGVAEIDANGKITGFQEKPEPDKAISKLASTAIYALNSAFIKEHLPAYTEMKHNAGEKADKIGDLWAHFVSELHIAGHPFEGIWGDIGNCKDYLDTCRQAFDYFGTQKDKFAGIISPQAQIAKSAEIVHPVIIEDNCVIRENARIGPYVHIMHDSIIGKRTQIHNAVIFERNQIGDDCKISNSIIDGHSAIGENCEVSDYSVVGCSCKVMQKSRLASAKIYPTIIIQPNSEIKGDLTNNTTPNSPEMIKSMFWK